MARNHSYLSKLEEVTQTNIANIQQNAFLILNAKNGSGKTHYISELSWEVLSHYYNDDKRISYENLLCLTGTAFDRFPKLDKYKEVCEKHNKLGNLKKFLYLGYNVNGNISTLINPFRVLFNSITISDGTLDRRVNKICSLLLKIGFSNKIKIEFRDGENTKKVIKPEEYHKYKLSQFKDNSEIELTEANINILLTSIQNKTNKTEIGDIFFCKTSETSEQVEWFSLYNLSSGEYSFIRAIFCLCLGLKNNSLLLYDEPENSLHPTWQVELIENVVEIITEFQKAFQYQITTIIATHSPLITSNIYHENVYFAQKNQDNIWEWEQQKNFLGWVTNDVLQEQFNMYSSRSKQFIDTFQKVLDLYVRKYYLNEKEQKDFNNLRTKLQSLNIKLHKDDPLLDLYYTITNTNP